MMARLTKRFGYTVAILGLWATVWSVQAADDPLPSWNDGHPMSTQLAFALDWR